MIVPILLIGLVFRLVSLNQSLWLDEAITAITLRNLSFLDILTKFSPGDFHPPLFYLVEKLWTNIFGVSEIALRLPSVFFGVGTIFFTYLLAKKLFSSKTAIIAALLAAFNPLLIYYSQEARMYSFATFLVAGCMYFLVQKKWAFFTIFLAASFYSDYLPFLMIPVYFLLASSKKRFLLSLSIALAAFLPWVPVLFHQLAIGVSGGDTAWGDLLGRTNFKNLILVPLKFTTGRITIDDKYIYDLLFGGILLLVALIASRAKSKISWMWLMIPITLAALISIRIPLLTYFRFLFLVPPFILLSSEGLAGKRILSLLLFGIFISSSLAYLFFPKFQREDWRQTAKFVSDGQVVMPSRAQSAGIKYYRPDLVVADKKNFVPNGRSPVYLIRYVQELFDPTDSLRLEIENYGYSKISEKNYQGIVVWKFIQ